MPLIWETVYLSDIAMWVSAVIHVLYKIKQNEKQFTNIERKVGMRLPKSITLDI